MTTIELQRGKYTVIYGDDRGKFIFEALRYGEAWRDLTGDGLILALCQRIEELEIETGVREGDEEILGIPVVLDEAIPEDWILFVNKDTRKVVGEVKI